MEIQGKINQIIIESVHEINSQLTEEQQILISNNTPLFGENSNIDSLGLVTLMVSIEHKIEDEFDLSITIADERAMAQKNSPFKTIGTLTEYVGYLVKDIKGEND